MNTEPGNEYEEQEISLALQRYEKMLKEGRKVYFDVFQLEHIVDSFLEEGKIYPALQAAEMGLVQHPASIALKVKKAGILMNLGEIEQALMLINELLFIEKTNYELHLLQGSCYLLLGDSKSAQKSFNLTLKYSTDDRAETIFNIGFAYEQNGDYQRAIEYLKEAVYLDQKNEEALYELAYCYEKINENEKSIKVYDKFLDIDPFSESAWFNLGILYTKVSNYEKSIWAYDFALALNDDFPNAWFNIAHSYLLLKDYEKSIECFNSFLKFDPENDEVLCYIGECYTSMNNVSEAESFFEKSLQSNPLNSKSLYNIGLLKIQQKQFLDALDYLRKAVNSDDDNSQFLFALASAATEIKYFNEAATAFEKACEIEPMELSYWLSYSEMLFLNGQVVKAIEQLEIALDFHPNETLLSYRKAAYLLESGNEEQSFELIQDTLKLDYENHVFLFKSYPDAANHKRISNLIKEYKGSKE